MDTLLRRRQMMSAGGSPTPPGPTPTLYNYLYFDGAAFIETDIQIPENGSIRVGMGSETQKIKQRLFCAYSGGNYIAVNIGGNTSSTKRYFVAYYDSSSAVQSSVNVNWTTDRYSLYITPKRYGLGTGAQTFTKGSNHPTGGLNVGGWSFASGQAYTGKIQPIRIYGSDAQNATDASDLFNNYTPVYTLWPCVYNGQTGLWCIETSRFYGNTAGAGTLTASDS